MKRATWLFVQDILEAISQIKSYVGTMTFEEFRNDEKTTSAVVWKIHVIGEATKNIQKTLQQIGHGDNPDNNLMFAGHAAYRFGSDPFYANGFIPTVKQLVDRICTGD